jgi:hypothetical protein
MARLHVGSYLQQDLKSAGIQTISDFHEIIATHHEVAGHWVTQFYAERPLR